MAKLKINDSSKSVVKEFAPYVGVTKVKVLAVNPTLEELQNMGLNFQQEPEYVGQTDEGIDKVRIDFFVGNDKLITKVSFFLEATERINRNGDKYEIINNKGQSTWAVDVQEAVTRKGKNGNTWFSEVGARKAYVGEVDLMTFIADWLNISPEDDLELEDFSKLLKGNVSELKQYAKEAVNNEFYILLTVKKTDEGKIYQNTYNRLFARGSLTPASTISRFVKHINEQETAGYPIKGFEGVEFKEFIPSLETAQPDEDDEGDEGDDKLTF